MSTKLDHFLETIDPSRNLVQVLSRADAGFNSFSLESGTETDYESFGRLLARFFCHMENVMLRLKPQRSPNYEFDYSRCLNLLRKEYGDQADKVAFEFARTGVEGGLYGVFKTITNLMVEDYAGNEIRAKVNHFWGNLTLDEKFEVPSEYIKKYGHLLPSEMTEGFPGRVIANFIKVLEEHPRLVLKMRQVGR